MLRGDNVKDEEGYRAVFTEQGASACQMAAAKFLDTMSNLPGMPGETNDAISAYTRVKMPEAPRWFRMPKEDCFEIWIRIPPRQRPNIGILLKTPQIDGRIMTMTLFSVSAGLSQRECVGRIIRCMTVCDRKQMCRSGTEGKCTTAGRIDRRLYSRTSVRGVDCGSNCPHSPSNLAVRPRFACLFEQFNFTGRNCQLHW